MRIVYCIDNYGAGGIQQITVVKANALAEKPGNRVWIAYTDLPQEGGFHSPSDKVQLIDLGIRYRNNHLRFPWNLFKYLSDNKKHKTALAAFLKEIHPDIVISTGKQEKYFIPSIKGPWGLIKELHISKGVRVMRASTWWEKRLAWILEWFEYRNVLQKYNRLVVFTSEEKDRAWGKDSRVAVIPNPTRVLTGHTISYSQKRIIAVGRLEAGKNYASLIRAFSILAPRFPDWSLSIFGDGSLRSDLQSQINVLGLSECVSLPGFASDLESCFVKSSFFVHTSLYETFGMVIIEAMGCGLPAIAYDCPYGPKSIIGNNIDGYLVPMGDESALVSSMASLMENESLRKQMGMAAMEKAKRFSIDHICSLWEQLFQQVILEKSNGRLC